MEETNNKRPALDLFRRAKQMATTSSVDVSAKTIADSPTDGKGVQAVGLVTARYSKQISKGKFNGFSITTQVVFAPSSGSPPKLFVPVVERLDKDKKPISVHADDPNTTGRELEYDKVYSLRRLGQADWTPFKEHVPIGRWALIRGLRQYVTKKADGSTFEELTFEVMTVFEQQDPLDVVFRRPLSMSKLTTLTADREAFARAWTEETTRLIGPHVPWRAPPHANLIGVDETLEVRMERGEFPSDASVVFGTIEPLEDERCFHVTFNSKKERAIQNPAPGRDFGKFRLIVSTVNAETQQMETETLFLRLREHSLVAFGTTDIAEWIRMAPTFLLGLRAVFLVQDWSGKDKKEVPTKEDAEYEHLDEEQPEESAESAEPAAVSTSGSEPPSTIAIAFPDVASTVRAIGLEIPVEFLDEFLNLDAYGNNGDYAAPEYADEKTDAHKVREGQTALSMSVYEGSIVKFEDAAKDNRVSFWYVHPFRRNALEESPVRFLAGLRASHATFEERKGAWLSLSNALNAHLKDEMPTGMVFAVANKGDLAPYVMPRGTNRNNARLRVKAAGGHTAAAPPLP